MQNPIIGNRIIGRHILVEDVLLKEKIMSNIITKLAAKAKEGIDNVSRAIVGKASGNNNLGASYVQDALDTAENAGYGIKQVVNISLRKEAQVKLIDDNQSICSCGNSFRLCCEFSFVS